jgi:hypothetical protein
VDGALVIAADVAVGELTAQAWGELCLVVQQRRRATPWAYVVHDGRCVVAVESPRPVSAKVGDLVDAPEHIARRVRRESGCDRAVVVERSALDRLVADTVPAVAGLVDLAGYWTGVGEAFWSADGVVTDPAPPHNPWPAVVAALRNRGDRLRALVALTAGDEVPLAVRMQIVDGVIVSVDAVSLTSRSALDDAAADSDLVAVAPWDEAMAALGAPDAYAAAADLLTRAHTRGLDDITPLLRAAG